MSEFHSRTRVVLNSDLDDNPRCVHGPMLCFSRENEEGKKVEFFACSACRHRKECPGGVSGGEEQYEKQNLETHRSSHQRSKTKPSFYCSSCNILCPDTSGHESCSIHSITQGDLAHPTRILSPNSRDKTEAQYFFSEDCVDQLLRILKDDLKCNKIICLGTPRLHENIKQLPDFSSLLLDFDDRFTNFYSSEEFLKYNMFNHYFFCGPYSRDIFSKFLKNHSKRDKVCLIVDPPFGCRTEALTFTLKRIQLEYLTLNQAILPIIWVFPYFMEKYVVKSMPEMTMLDFKVNYTNHRSYNESGGRFGSPVRLFTNASPKLIKFGSSGFKYCVKCQMHTRVDNPHCNACDSCPSKNGAIYKHCPLCASCVKPYYVHCTACNRCAQQDHDCEEYQRNAFCWICDEKGHVERNCPLRPKKPLKLTGKSATLRTCLLCRKTKHNERQCREREKMIINPVVE